jgi:hypothetical protein
VCPAESGLAGGGVTESNGAKSDEERGGSEREAESDLDGMTGAQVRPMKNQATAYELGRRPRRARNSDGRGSAHAT